MTIGVSYRYVNESAQLAEARSLLNFRFDVNSLR
jgi:hypothetical protein